MYDMCVVQSIAIPGILRLKIILSLLFVNRDFGKGQDWW
jgi:hypothetical protein